MSRFAKWLLFVFLSAAALSSSAENKADNQNNQTEPCGPELEFVAPFTIMEFQTELAPQGRIKLVELQGSRLAKHSKAKLAQAASQAIREYFPEVELANEDMILVLDILGERNGIIRRSAVAFLAREVSDVVGVNIVTTAVTKSTRTESPGVERVFVVIKRNFKDYRNHGTKKLETQEDVAYWLGDALEENYRQLFNRSSFVFYDGSQQAKAAYLLLPPENIPGGVKLPESKFPDAMAHAYYSLMGNISGIDLLYLRPTIWDLIPKPDDFAIRTYQLIMQKSPEEFIKSFSQNAVRLRDQLFSKVYPKVRGSGTPSRIADDHTISNDELLSDRREMLSGKSAQESLGEDFYRGAEGRVHSLSEISVADDAFFDSAVEKMRQHGLDQFTNLEGMNAADVIDRAHLSIEELTSLARHLMDFGVYFFYPSSIQSKIPASILSAIRHPMNRSFIFNPRTQTYSPIGK